MLTYKGDLKFSLIRSPFRNSGNNFPTSTILKEWDLVQGWTPNWFVYLIMKPKCRNLESNFNALFAGGKKNKLNHCWLSNLPGLFSAYVIWFLFLVAQLHKKNTKNFSDLTHQNLMLVLMEPIPVYCPFKSLTGFLIKYSKG